ncbi:MAG TPA: glycerol-3-phosphate 1-O-acyltransferase PlsY [Rhizomicrobium sp.]|nr:glycerol-3-phosphate 1-O-acyltransferase PlsY [Rhizomicrobium sp.]
MFVWPNTAYALLIGYLLGSIPFGLIFTWLAGEGDVRKIGSGNIGATNVLRTGNRWAALATLIFDAAKGAAAVLIAAHYFGEMGAVAAAIGATLGHLFPVWLGFKGGKGVAVSLGILLALYWPVALMAAGTWIVAALLFRISSLAALIAAIAAPFYMLTFGLTNYAIATLVIAILVFIMHRDNIRRLTRGEEPRIGKSKA